MFKVVLPALFKSVRSRAFSAADGWLRSSQFAEQSVQRDVLPRSV
jgi:hypothetical protein